MFSLECESQIPQAVKEQAKDSDGNQNEVQTFLFGHDAFLRFHIRLAERRDDQSLKKVYSAVKTTVTIKIIMNGKAITR